MTSFKLMASTICCTTLAVAQSVVVTPPPQPSINNASPDYSMVKPTSNTSIVIDGSFSQHGILVSDLSKQPQLVAKLLPASTTNDLSVQKILPLLPFSIVVENANSLPVTSITIRYEKTTLAGTVAEETIFFNTRSHRSEQGLLPGQQCVIVPDPLVTTNLKRLQSGLPPIKAFGDVNLGKILNRFDSLRFTHVAVHLDSVVFEDGSIVGPDKWGMIAQQQAERSTAQESLQKLSDSSITDEQLSSWLQEKAHQPFLIHPEDHPIYDHLKYSEHSLAIMITHSLQTGGRAKAAQLVSSLIVKQNNEKQLRKMED